MNETKKTCWKCGRIITDPNNKSGLCPKCQKEANNVLGVLSFGAVCAGIRKFGPKIAKSVIKIVAK